MHAKAHVLAPEHVDRGVLTPVQHASVPFVGAVGQFALEQHAPPWVQTTALPHVDALVVQVPPPGHVKLLDAVPICATPPTLPFVYPTSMAEKKLAMGDESMVVAVAPGGEAWPTS